MTLGKKTPSSAPCDRFSAEGPRRPSAPDESPPNSSSPGADTAAGRRTDVGGFHRGGWEREEAHQGLGGKKATRNHALHLVGDREYDLHCQTDIDLKTISL